MSPSRVSRSLLVGPHARPLTCEHEPGENYDLEETSAGGPRRRCFHVARPVSGARCRAGIVALAIVVFGRPLIANADETWGDRVEEAPQSGTAPQYLRTAFEELGFLGFQTAWYWGHSFHGDEKFNWHNWSTRLTSTHDMVLDDDKFRTGAVGHPIAGAGYYLIARGNGFGAVASFAITVLASTTWQYFSEWNEKPATNDLTGHARGGLGDRRGELPAGTVFHRTRAGGLRLRRGRALFTRGDLQRRPPVSVSTRGRR